MDYAMLVDAKIRARHKHQQRYALAKSLGFNGYECPRLANCSEETIRRIAAERDSIKAKP
jgi:hypothetical protein